MGHRDYPSWLRALLSCFPNVAILVGPGAGALQLLGLALAPPPHFVFRGIGSDPASVLWGKARSVVKVKFGAIKAMSSARLVQN